MKLVEMGLGLVAIGIVGVAPAHASELYGAVRAGQTTNTSVSGIDLNDGFAYGGAVGGAIGPIRVEAAADHLAGDFAGVVKATAWDYSLSGLIDVPISSNTAVFGGAGVDHVEGAAKVPFGSYSASGNGWNWQVGVSHRFAPGVMGEVRYRRVSASLDGSGASVDLDTDQITTGIRFAL